LALVIDGANRHDMKLLGSSVLVVFIHCIDPPRDQCRTEWLNHISRAQDFQIEEMTHINRTPERFQAHQGRFQSLTESSFCLWQTQCAVQSYILGLVSLRSILSSEKQHF
jgi:hypothetical protein